MMQRLLRAAALLPIAALVGCGSDYYYLSGVEIEGDTLLAHFSFTCPGVRLAWDGAFPSGNHVDLSVHATGDDCEDAIDTFFDLGPMKRAYVALQREPLETIDIRVPGYDDTQRAKCVSFIFSPHDVEKPGWGFDMECH